MCNSNTEIMKIEGKPTVFPYHVLKAATGSFNVSSKLGEGGFGVVYKVRNSSTHILVVVKPRDSYCCVHSLIGYQDAHHNGPWLMTLTWPDHLWHGLTCPVIDTWHLVIGSSRHPISTSSIISQLGRHGACYRPWRGSLHPLSSKILGLQHQRYCLLLIGALSSWCIILDWRNKIVSILDIKENIQKVLS